MAKSWLLTIILNTFWVTFFANNQDDYIQSLDVKVYGQSDGISYKCALATVQDKNGFIWVGTQGYLAFFL